MNILFIGNTWSQDEFRKALNETSNHCFVKSQNKKSLEHWENIMGRFDWVVIERQITECGMDADQSLTLKTQLNSHSSNEIIKKSDKLLKGIEQGIILSYSAPVKRRA